MMPKKETLHTEVSDTEKLSRLLVGFTAPIILGFLSFDDVSGVFSGSGYTAWVLSRQSELVAASRGAG